jgi:murein DD-endopeptidase MepM/ murein hydrolase activator NlpD
MVTLAPALLSAATLAVGALTLSPVALSPAPPPPAAQAAVQPAGRPDPASAPAATGRLAAPRLAPRAGWRWPLEPRPAVTRAFQAPLSRWGPGHRGVDLQARPGQPVLAVAAGRVTHAGVVAGRGTVTLLHTGGLRTTYEPVEAGVRTGEAVSAGQRLGVLQAGGSHCRACLHLGAVRGRLYVDPLRFLRPSRVVLLPLTDP